MLRFCIVILSLWVIIFSWRVWQEGGFTQDYRDEGVALLEPIQQAIDHQIHVLVPEPSAAILSGMLLGVQGNVPYLFKKKLQLTSTIHLLVVSGQNLSLIGSFTNKILQPLGRKRASYLTIMVIIIYSILTGFGVPVIRALVMSLIALGGQLLGRQSTSWWILSATAALMLLVQPNWLFSISFQLSFLATAGAVIVSSKIEHWLKYVPELIRSDLSVSIAAQLLTIPVIGYNFQQLSIIGVFINVLVLWIVSPVMIIGSVGLVVSLVSQTAAEVILLVPHLLLIYFVKIIEFFAQFPWVAVVLPVTSLTLWFIYYLLLIMVNLKYGQATITKRSAAGNTAVGLAIN